MNNLASIESITSDITTLLDGWIKAEQNGVQFPVPFEAAWRIAEYSNKANAKQSGLRSLKKGIQFSLEIMKTPGGGRSSELINLSIDGFKHFCLMADTPQGEKVRQYFIDTEKKWRLVQEVAPKFSQEIDILHLRREVALIEAQKAELELRKSELDNDTLKFRDTVYKLQDVAIADRIFGVQTFEVTKIRDRIVDDSGHILNAANTVTKTELANRYGFISKTGKADTKTVTRLIEEAISSGAISNPWHDIRVVASSGFDAQLVPTLDKFFDSNPQQRQRWMGEN